MRRAYADLLTLALVMLAPPAMADDAPTAPRVAFRLEYAAPSGAQCPASSALAELTSAKFRYDAFPDAARASLSVTVRRAAGRLEAALVARDDQGAVQWEETATPRWKCDELVEDVALMIYARFMTPKGETPEAWTLLVSQEPSQAPAPLRAPSPAPSPPRAPEPFASQPPLPATPTPRVPEPPFRRELSVAFVVGLLDTPATALGGAIQAAARWPWFSLGVEVRGAVDHRGEVAGDPVRLWLGGLTGIPCLVVHSRVRTCFPVAGGFLQATGGEKLVFRTGTIQPFAGSGLRVSYDQPLSQALWLRAHGEVLLRMKGALLGNSPRSAWESPVVLPSLAIGIMWSP
ncbi:hypothetical protein [Polyangium spumosum]|uniref:Uncharacterized protein n=1 Tax=Polyangium spumosum TaxID=889282 RepID=A0A6N7Q1J2_9BACT|nr:hypothetical protein [Polyangium spumosum]MRG98153.1 hypothetical protein [Polyangium spumosum]